MAPTHTINPNATRKAATDAALTGRLKRCRKGDTSVVITGGPLGDLEIEDAHELRLQEIRDRLE